VKHRVRIFGCSRLRMGCVFIAAAALTVCSGTASAQDATYQYAVTVAHRTTYLWVLPKCPRVRGLVVAFANLSERRWLEDTSVRQVAARACLGIVWIGPGYEPRFRSSRAVQSRSRSLRTNGAAWAIGLARRFKVLTRYSKSWKWKLARTMVAFRMPAIPSRVLKREEIDIT